MAKNPLEMSSDQLKAELIEIKERIGSLETIATIANQTSVEQHVRLHLKGKQAKDIVKECYEPRTREYLMTKLDYKSPQALHHHLGPLQDNNLINQHFLEEGTVRMFVASKLFRQLSKKKQKDILEGL